MDFNKLVSGDTMIGADFKQYQIESGPGEEGSSTSQSFSDVDLSMVRKARGCQHPTDIDQWEQGGTETYYMDEPKDTFLSHQGFPPKIIHQGKTFIRGHDDTYKTKGGLVLKNYSKSGLTIVEGKWTKNGEIITY